ncbi:helix-turn-helix domain-containing protein [Nocardia wallacei]|uniref:helix-turn-helix domain-containing protein n=1 Tax=Nocardia wallacei TaxID=480035 RepID=UPI00245600DF|nr:helix-turn-helix domain-containing protein [Nocardia wallacei]
MSWQAVEWVLQECDADDYVEFRLLALLAHRANPDGTGAWPSVASLAEGIRRSPRTIQRGLERLRKAGRIRFGDQSLVPDTVAVNRRPTVWDVIIPGVTPNAETGGAGVTEDVTPNADSEVTPYVTSQPFGLTTGDTPDERLGVTPGVALGVTSGVIQNVLHSLRNENVLFGQNDPPPDSDPPPTKASPTKPSRRSASKPRATARRKPSVPLPDDWRPNESHNKLAREIGLSTAQARIELENFRDHARAKDVRFRDWDAGFRTWLRNSVKFGLKPAHGGGPAGGTKRERAVANGERFKSKPDATVLERIGITATPRQIALPGGTP